MLHDDLQNIMLRYIQYQRIYQSIDIVVIYFSLGYHSFHFESVIFSWTSRE